MLHGDVVGKIVSNLNISDALNARLTGTAWRDVPNVLIDWTLLRRRNLKLHDSDHGESRERKCIAAIKEGNDDVLEAFDALGGSNCDAYYLQAALETEDVKECFEIIIKGLGYKDLSDDPERLYKDLATHGRFDVLSRIAQHFELSKSVDYSKLLWHSYQCAAGWGDLEYMKRIIVEIRKDFAGYEFGDDDTYDIAAGAGKIEVLDWLVEKGAGGMSNMTLLHAATHEQWPVVRWGIEKGVDINNLTQIYYLLGSHGDVDTLECIMKNVEKGLMKSPNEEDFVDIVNAAAVSKNMDMLSAVHKIVEIKTGEIVWQFLGSIGTGGHMQVLQFFEFEKLDNAQQSHIFYTATKHGVNKKFTEEFKEMYPKYEPSKCL
jgi:hypothetical protein